MLKRKVEIIVCKTNGGDSGTWDTTFVLIPADTAESDIATLAVETFYKEYKGEDLVTFAAVYDLPAIIPVVTARDILASEVAMLALGSDPATDDFVVLPKGTPGLTYNEGDLGYDRLEYEFEIPYAPGGWGCYPDDGSVVVQRANARSKTISRIR